MVNAVEQENTNLTVEEARSKISITDGYLPVPIFYVSPIRLSDKRLFCLDANNNVVPYPERQSNYTEIHREFLLKRGVRYLYIPNSEYNQYLDAVSADARDIVIAQDLPKVEKCEFTYAFIYALAQHIINDDITRQTFVDSLKRCKSIVPVFQKNNDTYKIIFNCMLHNYDHAAHLANVSVIMAAFAKKIGITDEKTITHCCFGGILHDIGKRFIPADIIDNDQKLSELDLQIVKNHVLEGTKAIEKISRLPARVMSIISEHHETIDGDGYPKGLNHKQISIFGRMTRIVDLFEAMTSQRPYRNNSYSVEDSLNEIKAQSGIKLDSNIAGSFIQFIDGQIRDVSVSDDYYDGLILDDLGLTPEIGANPSGRRHERFYFRTRVKISKLNRKDDKWILSDTKVMYSSNISISGIALLNDYQQEVNQMVRIELEMPEDYDTTVQAIGKIVRCVKGSGMFTIGIEFLKYMDLDKVKEIHNLLK